MLFGITPCLEESKPKGKDLRCNHDCRTFQKAFGNNQQNWRGMKAQLIQPMMRISHHTLSFKRNRAFFHDIIAAMVIQMKEASAIQVLG